MVEELNWPRNQNYMEDVHDLEDHNHEADHLALDLPPGEEVTKEVNPNPGAAVDPYHPYLRWLQVFIYVIFLSIFFLIIFFHVKMQKSEENTTNEDETEEKSKQDDNQTTEDMEKLVMGKFRNFFVKLFTK